MKTIFIEDNRLREIITDRNKEILRLLLNGTIKGTIRFKLSTKEFEGRICYGWEITDLENGYKIEERYGKVKEPIKSTGTTIPVKDLFFPIDQ